MRTSEVFESDSKLGHFIRNLVNLLISLLDIQGTISLRKHQARCDYIWIVKISIRSISGMVETRYPMYSSIGS